MNFYESTDTQKSLAGIGRSMMDYSENYGKVNGLATVTNNGMRTLNSLSFIGQQLTRVGATFGIDASDFTDSEREMIAAFIGNEIVVQHEEVRPALYIVRN